MVAHLWGRHSCRRRLCHCCVVAGLVCCAAALPSAFTALAAAAAALAALAADVAPPLGFVGRGVRCLASRDAQPRCGRARSHRFRGPLSFAATTASLSRDPGGLWSLRAFVSPRTRPSWPWSPLHLFAPSLSNLSARAHTRRVHTHVQLGAHMRISCTWAQSQPNFLPSYCAARTIINS